MSALPTLGQAFRSCPGGARWSLGPDEWEASDHQLDIRPVNPFSYSYETHPDEKHIRSVLVGRTVSF